MLHELWRACLDSGLVMILDQRAHGATRPPEEDWDWQLLGTDLAVSHLVMQGDERGASYVFALWPHDFRVTVDVLADLGVWSRDGDRMTGTTWGSDLVDVLEEMVDMPDPFAGGTIEVKLPVDRP